MNSTTACTLCFCNKFTTPGKAAGLCACNPPKTLFGPKHTKDVHTRVINTEKETAK